ncbi:MAG TPA: hypothetical protein VF510_15515 [Ktedonobacterales bacterium]
MSHPRPPGRPGPRATVRLQDVIDVAEVPLSDRESAYHAPRTGDWFLLGLLVVVLLGNGLFVWHQVGSNQHLGRAVFFGLVLLCILWAAVVYTFKLSVGVRVGPHGVSIMRGPWRTELPWREVARLVERVQVVNGQRYRWVVVLARDERRLQVREDMVADYQRFRMDIYQRYRLWRERGGTWGATGASPFTQRETTSSQVVWWGIAAATTGLPGLYFTILLPETGLLGPALLAFTLVCGALSLRAFLRRYTYTVDAKAIEARSMLRTVRLPWRDVTRVERTRLPFGGILKVAVRAGRFVLWLADRGDARVRTFGWSPRVPEYLTMRGTGRLVRIALHRVGRPDELLAWVEFYERLGRRATASEQVRRTAAPATKPVLPELPAPDLSSPSGPLDPWGGARDGDLEPASATNAAGMVDSEAVGALEAQDTAPAPALDRTTVTDAYPATAVAANPPRDPWLQDLGQHDSWEQSGWLQDAVVQDAELQEPQQLPWERDTNSSGIAARPSAAQSPFRQAAPLPWERASHNEQHKHYEPRQAAMSPTPPMPPAAAVPISEDAHSSSDQSHEPWEAPWMGLAPAEEAGSDGFDDPSTPWRHEAAWQPPQLPRFGPPSAARQQPNKQSDRQDSDQFSKDQFLR